MKSTDRSCVVVEQEIVQTHKCRSSYRAGMAFQVRHFLGGQARTSAEPLPHRTSRNDSGRTDWIETSDLIRPEKYERISKTNQIENYRTEPYSRLDRQLLCFLAKRAPMAS